MARWSYVMKLSEFDDHDSFLDASGCYEIGFYRGGVFSPKYVGRTNDLHRRASEYMDPARCHNSEIYDKLCADRHNLYFRVIRTERHHGLEARLQARHGVRHGGVYVWNKRVEWSHIAA